MDWELVGARLQRILSSLKAAVRERHPNLLFGIHPNTPFMGERYALEATLMLEPHSDSEDIGLRFWCRQVGLVLRRDSEPFFLGVRNRDAAGFDIEDGSGWELASLEPELLPSSPSSPEYAAAVMAYLDRVDGFLRANRKLILDVLAGRAAELAGPLDVDE